MALIKSKLQSRTKYESAPNHIRLVARISQQHLLRPVETQLAIGSLSVRLAADELFIADTHNGAVRSLSLRSGLLGVRDAFSISRDSGCLHAACYIESLDSLLLCISESKTSWLLVLSHDNSEWSERARIPIPITSSTGPICWLLNLDAPNVLFAERGTHRLLVERVTNEYVIETTGRVNLSGNVLAIDARIDESGDILVAVAFEEEENFTVYRLVDHVLCELLRLQVPAVASVLLLNDRLLAAVQPPTCASDCESHSIVELDLSGENESSRRSNSRELIGGKERIAIRCWCSAGQRVAMWDSNSSDILVFALK